MQAETGSGHPTAGKAGVWQLPGVPHPFFILWWAITGIISSMKKKTKHRSYSQPPTPPKHSNPHVPRAGLSRSRKRGAGHPPFLGMWDGKDDARAMVSGAARSGRWKVTPRPQASDSPAPPPAQLLTSASGCRSGWETSPCFAKALCGPSDQDSPGTRTHRLQLIDMNGFAPSGAGE